jgi:hypothetical protein
MWECRLDSCGSGYGSEPGSCGHGNEPSECTEGGGNNLVSWMVVSFLVSSVFYSLIGWLNGLVFFRFSCQGSELRLNLLHFWPETLDRISGQFEGFFMHRSTQQIHRHLHQDVKPAHPGYSVTHVKVVRGRLVYLVLFLTVTRWSGPNRRHGGWLSGVENNGYKGAEVVENLRWNNYQTKIRI